MAFESKSTLSLSEERDVVAASQSPATGGVGIDSTNFVSVQAKGAVGDGIADDTEAIRAAMETARRTGEKAYFPAGDYFVTGELPMYSGMTWLGDGDLFQNRYELSVVETQEQQAGRWKVYLDDPNDVVSHRIMDGDPISTKGFDNPDNNGLFAVEEPVPSESAIVIKNSSGTTVSSPSSSAACEVRVTEGGSIIRHKNLGDGSLYTGGRFIDERGLREIGMQGIGFVGPGINSTYGGGLRFRRSAQFTGQAITGYTFKNVSLEHSAMAGFEFGQLIHSSFQDMRINRCVRDGMLFEGESGIGGASTSLHFDTIYVSGCRRGIAADIIVYSSFSNCVVEGCHFGYFMDRAIGCTFDSCASETIKFERNGSGGGATFRFVDSYSNVLNGPTAYYNTNQDEWSKAAVEVIDPGDRTESQAVEIRGGHIHESLQERIPVVATRWDASTNTARYYIDVRKDPAYVPPEDGSSSSWQENSYWREGEMSLGIGHERDALLNQRYEMQNIEKLPFQSGNAAQKPRPPGPDDDSDAGYTAFDSLWIDTSVPEREGRYFCIRDEVGNARWVDAEGIWLVESDGRQYNPLDKKDATQDPPPYLIDIGRKFGADIVTDHTLRGLETAASGQGELITWIDPSELHPTRYFVSVTYDPFEGGGSRRYAIQDNRDLETIDGTTYWIIKLIVANPPDDHNWSNQWESKRQVRSEFDALGLEVSFDVSYVYEDETTESLFLAIDTREIIRSGDKIELFNAREPNMNREWEADEIEWADSQASSGTHPSVRVKAGYQDLDPDITRSVDEPLVRIDRWAAPVTSEVVESGTDVPLIYDPNDSLSVEGGRDLSVVFEDGSAQVTVPLEAANQYQFHAYVSGSFTQAKVTSVGRNEITVERDTSTGREEAQVRARRKVSPGFEMVAGKPNDATEPIPERTGDLTTYLTTRRGIRLRSSNDTDVQYWKDHAGKTNFLSQDTESQMPQSAAEAGRNGLRFDGASTHLTDNPNGFSSETFTVLAWLYRSSNADEHIAVSKGTGANGTLAFAFGGDAGSDQVIFKMQDSGGTVHSITSSAGSFPVGEWVFAGVKYDGSDMEVLINGQVDTSVTDSFTPTQDDSTGLTVGAAGEGGADYFDGLIRQVRIYEASVPMPDVEAIYHESR